MPSSGKIEIPPPAPHPTVHNFVDHTGREFDRLTVRHYCGRVSGKPSWVCDCKCGTVAIVPTKQLNRKQTRSCGCLQIERTKSANTSHGKKGARIYRIWTGMLTRCRNQKSKDYHRYGGRGITVCERWLTFENFLADMGEPPDGMEIERKENSGNYEPGNCIWATEIAQANNRSSSVFVDVNGMKMTAAQWDRYLKRTPGTTAKRIRKGWPAEKAVGVMVNPNLARGMYNRGSSQGAASGKE